MQKFSNKGEKIQGQCTMKRVKDEYQKVLLRNEEIIFWHIVQL